MGRDSLGQCYHVRGAASEVRKAMADGTLRRVLTGEISQFRSSGCPCGADWFKRVVHGLAASLNARAHLLTAKLEDLPPIRGRCRARRLDPDWCERVAIGCVQDGIARSASG
eukprot:6845208-Pyramimonas_sp.AAC.1